MHKQIAFVTEANVQVTAHDYITAQQQGPLNDLLVSYAHSYLTHEPSVPACTSTAKLVLQYVNDKCVYKNASGTVFAKSELLEDRHGEWTVKFKANGQRVKYIEANEYDSFIQQFL